MGPRVAPDAERDLAGLTDAVDDAVLGGGAVMRRGDVKAREEDRSAKPCDGRHDLVSGASGPRGPARPQR